MGAKVFLLTDSQLPVYATADAVVRCENNSLLLTNSYVGMVAVIQVFINMLFVSSEENLVARMKKVVDIEKKDTHPSNPEGRIGNEKFSSQTDMEGVEGISLGTR